MDGKAGGRVTWATAVALAIVAGCLLLASGARAATVDVPATSGPADMPGTTPFVDAGAVQGSASISATGTIDIGYGDGDTPDGAPTAVSCATLCPAPTFTYWSLIARIGNGPWQEVGSGPTTVVGTGELYLGVDDDGYSDNSGDWTATVTADPATSDNPRLAVAIDGTGSQPAQNGSVTSTSAPIDCGQSNTECFTSYDPGTPVTLSAVATSGYTFTGWVEEAASAPARARSPAASRMSSRRPSPHRPPRRRNSRSRTSTTRMAWSRGAARRLIR